MQLATFAKLLVGDVLFSKLAGAGGTKCTMFMVSINYPQTPSNQISLGASNMLGPPSRLAMYGVAAWVECCLLHDSN